MIDESGKKKYSPHELLHYFNDMKDDLVNIKLVNKEQLDKLNTVITNHTKDDFHFQSNIVKRLDESEEERRKRHEEVMMMIGVISTKLEPLFNAFQFKSKLEEENMNKLIRYTKVLIFILAVISLLVYIWKSFVFGVNQIRL